MKLVVDANVLFAALIKDGVTANLLFMDGLDLYAPEYLLEEFEEYRGEILRKTHRTSARFDEVLSELTMRFRFVPHNELHSMLKAGQQISPDIDDAIYFALALKFEMPIWSSDARLKNQSAVRVYSTSDLLNIYSAKLGG